MCFSSSSSGFEVSLFNLDKAHKISVHVRAGMHLLVCCKRKVINLRRIKVDDNGKDAI